MKNYKTDVLNKMSKNELIKFIQIDQHLVEKLEIEYAGYTHTGLGNGPDGLDKDGNPIELKSQMWAGNTQLFGRAKYSQVSAALVAEKIATNEKTYIVGYDRATGDVFYRFKFRFAAIAKKYERTVRISHDKNWSNCDVIPKHYATDPSFEILYVADTQLLIENKHKFKPKFLHWLLEYNETHKADYKMFDMNYNATVSYKWNTIISILEDDKRQQEANIG